MPSGRWRGPGGGGMKPVCLLLLLLAAETFTKVVCILFLPDSVHDVAQELDDLLLTLPRSLEDVEDGLGGGLVVGQQPLQPHVQRLLDRGLRAHQRLLLGRGRGRGRGRGLVAALLQLLGLGVALGLLGAVASLVALPALGLPLHPLVGHNSGLLHPDGPRGAGVSI